MAVTQQRKDIQGLRALAVLLVVAGHLFPTAVKGGFIGVDIFFVISGFVITQQMLKNHMTTDKGFLLNFYAKRICRILPSALLVTLVSIWATNKFLGPVAANNATLDGGWATVFLSNFHFQSTALDYFATGTQTSPLQHFWSLSIEEQFYLMWPALFIVLFARSLSMRTKQIILGFIIAFSFLAAMYQSSIDQSAIFFSTWARIWELAVGAFIAINAKTIQLPKFVLTACVTLIALASLTIPQTMQWPRLTTIPIIAATAIVLLRNPRLGAYSLFENRIATYIGDLSYIIYLWHWPVLTNVKGYYGKFEATQILLVVALTALLSVATHHLFENPIRYSQLLSRRPAITVAGGSIAIAITAIMLFNHFQG
jgi:peptidoglycan/LPS O-acetylase OafA/YrhL